ncbi:glycosyltransferase [Treponema sp.]|uniref:glycosyltransferase n=1 Tax=Treponema sp. TaxID=166 RepID=UPI00298E8526|nr:glycosyltransferase [Treponema sp.]MCR5612439.1 glycosyltransferase [Treponema sp.]
MQKSSCAPIALFIYNRPDHTLQTLKALSENSLAKKSDLFIFADGPKNNASDSVMQKIQLTREAAKSKKWCKSVTVIESEKNKGLAQSIISGVTQIVNQYGKVIVLEDDLVTSPYFLQYMNDALDIYQNEPHVACINGYVEPHSNPLPETFFLRGADCWGWATWKRAWDVFNPDGKALLKEIKARHCQRHFNFDNTCDYVRMLKDQIAGYNNSWAVRWLASAYLNDMYCLYPDKTLVTNVGFDGSGTHCEAVEFNQGQLSYEPVKVIYQEPKESPEGFEAFKQCFYQRKRGSKSLFAYILHCLIDNLKKPVRPTYYAIKKWRKNR